MIFEWPFRSLNSSYQTTRGKDPKYEQGGVDDKNDIFKLMIKRPFKLIFNTNFREKALSKKWW